MNTPSEARTEPSPLESPPSTGRKGNGRAAAAAVTGGASGVVGALAAACCGPLIAPVAVAVLGASGAARITMLSPWAPYLLGGGMLLLAYAYRSVWVARACRPAGPSQRKRLDRVTPALLVLATLLWAASAAAYLVTALLG